MGEAVGIGPSLSLGSKGGMLAAVAAVAHRNSRPKAARPPSQRKRRVVERTKVKVNRTPEEDTTKRAATCTLQSGMSE